MKYSYNKIWKCWIKDEHLFAYTMKLVGKKEKFRLPELKYWLYCFINLGKFLYLPVLFFMCNGVTTITPVAQRVFKCHCKMNPCETKARKKD